MKEFNHSNHTDLLEEAETALRNLGRNDLAGAVSRARSIHFDTMGRISQARQEIKCIKRVQNELESVVQALEKYTVNPNAPWIEPSEKLY